MVNSRHGITFSLKVPSKFSRSRSSSIEQIIPPFPLVKNPDNFFINWSVKFKTEELSKCRKSKRFEEHHNLIDKLHKEGMGNKHTIDRFKVDADKDMRKMSNIVENLIRRYVESRV